MLLKAKVQLKKMMIEHEKIKAERIPLMMELNSVNMMAAELKRKFTFRMKPIRKLEPFPVGHMIVKAPPSFVIRVHNKEDRYYYDWEPEKFMDRYFQIKDIYQDFIEDGKVDAKIEKKSDPFWDPPNPILIGQAFLSLANLPLLETTG